MAQSLEALEAQGLVDLLDSDPRPSFVVDLQSETPGTGADAFVGRIIYTNPAVRWSGPLCHSLDSLPNKVNRPFWDWLTALSLYEAAAQSPLPYLGLYWTRIIVRNRWVIASSNQMTPSSERPHKIRRESRATPPLMLQKHTASTGSGASGASAPPIVVPPPENAVTIPNALSAETEAGQVVVADFVDEVEPFLAVVHDVAWDKTPLGPRELWSDRLRHMFNQIISDSRPIAIYWGPSATTIYNEAFSKLLGVKHPELLGAPVDRVWPEAAEQVRFVMDSQKQRRVEDESRHFVESADGMLQETYLKWSIAPVMEDQEILGFMQSVLDLTSLRLWERRMKMLIDLGDVLVSAVDAKAYYTKVVESLRGCEPTWDIPLAVMYSVEQDPFVDEGDSGPYDFSELCQLEGTLGVPANHPLTPLTIRLAQSDEGLASNLRAALRSTHPLLIDFKDCALPEGILEGIEWRGFGDPCRSAVVCPIRPTNEEKVMGLLILGLNPRRPYDLDYHQYIALLNQKLTNTLASTVLLEGERRRGHLVAEQAVIDKRMLAEQLELRTMQANESMQRFKAVSDFVPVGMCFGDSHGNIIYANDTWHKITGYPKGTIEAGAMLACVLEDDEVKIAQAYEELHEKGTVMYEFRIKANCCGGGKKLKCGPAPPFAMNDPRVQRHVLASAKAERAPDGSILSILTCLTDVTAHKNTAEEAIKRAQEAENLKRMAEFATVGMYDMDMNGRLRSANNVFFELTGLARVNPSQITVKPWPHCVVPEDIPILQRSIDKLTLEGTSQTSEIRLRTPWVAQDGAGNRVVADRWVLATFMPVKGSDGVTRSFTGCLSDVSLQKWQLGRERKRKEEVLESKRQQDNFIDMTSHEMRNPLSAIIHCADAIQSSLVRASELQNERPMTPGLEGDDDAKEEEPQKEAKLIDESIENAEIIVTCAQHQKRIVDDILTMSKLDSKLLAVTPHTVDAVEIVHDVVKMFEAEARRHEIDISTKVDQSFYDTDLDFLDFDPSRVKQVLINLLTNAIKFTKGRITPKIDVVVKASRAPPDQGVLDVQFIPRAQSEEADYEQPELRGRSDPVYLMFEVTDTGQGISDEEMQKLFNKFVQASTKTHIHYGGSGLGLFISKRLTELQNGAIGVSSRPGVGSTFAFYIEAFRPSEQDLAEARAQAAAAAVINSRDEVESVNSGTTGSQSRHAPGAEARFSHRHQSVGGNVRIDGVLVVEDNIINQQIVKRGLVSRGFTVDVANHGLEALEKLYQSADAARQRFNDRPPTATFVAPMAPGAAKKKPKAPVIINLVLMDVEMPVQDGLTCARQIRRMEMGGEVLAPSGGRIPIIAVSANARPEQIAEAKAAGCDDVLVKPYHMAELIEKMQVVVRKIGGLTPSSPQNNSPMR